MRQVLETESHRDQINQLNQRNQRNLSRLPRNAVYGACPVAKAYGACPACPMKRFCYFIGVTEVYGVKCEAYFTGTKETKQTQETQETQETREPQRDPTAISWLF